jgi:tetrahydrodipicolinate N-succinyltransferase
VIVNPVKDENDYATLVPFFYFGNMTMGEETVGENKLITAKYNSSNKITLSVDEKFKVPQMGGTEVPMKVDCIADMTAIEEGYKAVGETNVSLMGLTLPVNIEAIFDGAGKVDMNIYVIEVPMMGDITINFKGTGDMIVEPCFLPD